MHFQKTSIPGAFLIDIAPKTDDRGFFARVFCTREFARHGIKGDISQSNLCFNHKKGTVRGMHFQASPALESKLIRCVRGAIHDVIVDMRPGSDSYLESISVELTAENRRALFVPELCAHGYQTLTDDAEILYQSGGFYSPECERGVRYDDPALKLTWPLEVAAISDKDRDWPLTEAASAGDLGASCWPETICHK